MSETVRLVDLSIGYKGLTLLEGINASVSSGQLTCLLGSNGVGKSTLLRTMAGFQAPLAGQVLIEGQPFGALRGKQLARKVSIVLTEKPPVSNITVAELVGMGRSPYTGFFGSLSAEDRAVVSRSLHLVGMETFSDRMIQTLSDGERQKVMIAKALAQQTPVIFLDEPTAFLDFPSKVETMQLLHHLAAGLGKTVFLSTHDLELALQLADTLWMMDGHHGLSIGTPRQLAQQNRLSEYVEREDIVFDKENLTIRVKGQDCGA